MRAETLALLVCVARGEVISNEGGTGGTGGTSILVPPRKPAVFHQFHPFHLKSDKEGNGEFHGGTAGGTSLLPDDIETDERAAIAVELGKVPPAYAHAWAAFQMRRLEHQSEAEWLAAVDDAGRFLDEWATLALDFGWRPEEIFSQSGLAWFCAGERVRALGPGNAITSSGRIFVRPHSEEEKPK
jgi:hypothetical protein